METRDAVWSITGVSPVGTQPTNEWVQLVIPTKQGFVLADVCIHPSNPSRDSTQLRFIHNGKLYSRWFNGRAYSQRYCVTLAKRYVQDIRENRN